VLGLPARHRPPDALRHAADLRTDVRPGLLPDPPGSVPRLDASELGALSRGGLWHPWLLGAELQAPDGAVAGALALRARSRGAWTAAANMALPGVLALVPEPEPSALQSLLDGRVNAIRQLPGRFAALSQDTLAVDEDLRPINVRRLLDLLRRACLLHGPAYVFEPNDGLLRRSVQRGFEGLLERLFRLGAFAGRRADEAFQVGVVSEPDAARLTVELRVAPARPLVFLTVRLVREDAPGLRVEGP
jgi:phage tail sheath protein FI